MLKKLVSMIVMVTFILTPAVSVHAMNYSDTLPAVQANNAVISPMFVGVNRITASLSISSSGTARGMVNVFPKNSSSLDYILTTASLVNSSGTKVKTWTNVKSTINSNGYFIFDQSYTVQNRGQYKLVYTVKCYKSGSVVDTASSETAYQTY
jgi:hypothetical protein